MANIFFLLKKIIADLVLPPTSLILMAFAGLLLLRHRPRLARTLLYTAVLSLFALSLPVVERGLLDLLRTPTLTEQSAASAQAIMILGGGIYRETPEYGDTVARYSLERIRYGAILARRYHLPVLVTGGQVYGGRPEGEVMAEVLRNEFGVEVRWVENRSRDTADNAKFAADIFKQDHINKVLLVTHDFHMLRALEECGTTAVQCIGAPITSGSNRKGDSWIEQLPNMDALFQSELALHELLGLLAQRIY